MCVQVLSFTILSYFIVFQLIWADSKILFISNEHLGYPDVTVCCLVLGTHNSGKETVQMVRAVIGIKMLGKEWSWSD